MPVNVPPVSLSSPPGRSPRRFAKSQPVESPAESRDFSWSPESRAFNEPEAMVDETFHLFYDIAALETELRPLRIELGMAMRKTALQAAVEDDSGKSVSLASKIRRLEQEYGDLIEEEEAIRARFSRGSEMKLRQTIEAQWDAKDDLDWELEELQERVVQLEAEKHARGLVKAEEVGKEQKKVLKMLKKRLGDLEAEEERLNEALVKAVKEKREGREETKVEKLERKLGRVKVERANREAEMSGMEAAHRKKVEILRAAKEEEWKSEKEAKERRSFNEAWKRKKQKGSAEKRRDKEEVESEGKDVEERQGEGGLGIEGQLKELAERLDEGEGKESNETETESLSKEQVRDGAESSEASGEREGKETCVEVKMNDAERSVESGEKGRESPETTLENVVETQMKDVAERLMVEEGQEPTSGPVLDNVVEAQANEVAEKLADEEEQKPNTGPVLDNVVEAQMKDVAEKLAEEEEQKPNTGPVLDNVVEAQANEVAEKVAEEGQEEKPINQNS